MTSPSISRLTLMSGRLAAREPVPDPRDNRQKSVGVDQADDQATHRDHIERPGVGRRLTHAKRAHVVKIFTKS